MSDPKHDRDSDRDSLTGWTLVDREGTPEDNTGDSPQPEEEEGAVGTNVPDDGEGNEEPDDESGCGMEEDEAAEEEEEPLPDDLLSMGQRVQEIKGESIKASSGSDSSDIETLECPGPDDFYEDHALAYDSLHSSLLSSSMRSFLFVSEEEGTDSSEIRSSTMVCSSGIWEEVADAGGDADLESLASTDVFCFGG
ncbi:uncharacterized protein LOC135212590 [Macrobrachium nipponense]|uniref:uncharacterized protein LOC135212590 n=1 Tax=Macrobrachium nipponense TaxID=159736 RepID=UPI0030C7FC2C